MANAETELRRLSWFVIGLAVASLLGLGLFAWAVYRLGGFKH